MESGGDAFQGVPLTRRATSGTVVAATITVPPSTEVVSFNVAGGQTMARMARTERRNLPERSAKIRRAVDVVLDNPSVTLRVETLGAWLNVRLDAAQRILSGMVSAGLLREVQRGVFVGGRPSRWG